MNISVILLVISFLAQPLIASSNLDDLWSYSLRSIDITNEKVCQTLPQPRPLLLKFVESYSFVKENQEIPWPEAAQVNEVARINIYQLQLMKRIMDYSFYNHANYNMSLQQLKEFMLKNDTNTKNLNAAFFLLLRMDKNWLANMKINKLLRNENRETSFMVLSAVGMGAYLTNEIIRGRIHPKRLLKLKKAVEIIIKRPQFANYIGGYGAVKSSVTRLDDLKDQIIDLEEKSQLKSITGDVKSSVWHSPMWSVDIGANHTSNELVDYNTYDFYTTLSSMVSGMFVGTITASHFRNKYTPGVRVRAALKGKSLPKTGLILGFGAGAAFEMAIGIGTYWAVASLIKGAEDLYMEYGLAKPRMEKYKSRLLRVEGEFWEQRLGKKIIGHNSDFDPILENPDPSVDYNLKISEALLDQAYAYKYALQQVAGFLRGHIEKEKSELSDEFIYSYLCAATRYQSYHLDNLAIDKGHRFPEDHLVLSKDQAIKTHYIGQTKLGEVLASYEADLIKLEKSINEEPKIKESLGYYTEGLRVITDVAKRSKRSFLEAVNVDLKASKNSDIYKYSASTQFDMTISLADTLYKKIMATPKSRELNKCFGSTIEDLNQKYF